MKFINRDVKNDLKEQQILKLFEKFSLHDSYQSLLIFLNWYLRVVLKSSEQLDTTSFYSLSHLREIMRNERKIYGHERSEKINEFLKKYWNKFYGFISKYRVFTFITLITSFFLPVVSKLSAILSNIFDVINVFWQNTKAKSWLNRTYETYYVPYRYNVLTNIRLKLFLIQLKYIKKLDDSQLDMLKNL